MKLNAEAPEKAEKVSPENVIVSVVVPTYNSAKTLEQCLLSITNQDYQYIELVIVDRYSKDRTREIALKYGANVLLKGPERSSQKNYGAENAVGEFLYFVDSDFVLERDTITKCVVACRDLDAIVTINYSVGRGLWGKSIALKERFLAHDPTIQNVRFIRKTVFLEAGSFDASLVIGEDLDLYARLLELRYRVGSVDAIEWHIGEPETLKEIAKRSFYYGKVVRAYFGKRKKYAWRQLSPFKISLLWSLVKTGSPYLSSLAIVDIIRWTSSLLGLICSRLR
jgi:glycosyltransferase involved in cell wall biosynthesis